MKVRLTSKDHDRFLLMQQKENELYVSGYRYIAGVDEAGRGPLAGPVCVASCILDVQKPIIGLNDSKKLSVSKREYLYEQIKQLAIAYDIRLVDATAIDRLNILAATKQAMLDSLKHLAIKPDYVLTDAVHLADRELAPQEALIKGDAQCNCIAAASILAKVTRDHYMQNLEEKYPGYGFAKHKGYGTKEHYQALENLGPCPEHRLTFLNSLFEQRSKTKIISSSDNALRKDGFFAEAVVAKVLQTRGFQILEHNYWLQGVGELDLIVASPDGKKLYVIEVKARRGEMYYQSSAESLDEAKKQRNRRIAIYYWRNYQRAQKKSCELKFLLAQVQLADYKQSKNVSPELLSANQAVSQDYYAESGVKHHILVSKLHLTEWE